MSDLSASSASPALLLAKVQEFAQALEDIAMIVAGHQDSDSQQAFYLIHERLTPYCGIDDLKPWLPAKSQS